MSIFTPTPYAVEGADDREVLDGVLVQQGADWWVRVDGQSTLFGPVRNSTVAVAGDRVCVAVAQKGAMYVVWPAGGATAAAGGPSSYSTQFGNGVATAFTITHALGTRDVVVSVYRTAPPNDEVLCNIEHTSIDTITIRTTAAPTLNQYTVAVTTGGSGGGAGGGGDKNYVHTQGIASATWVVAHNLGKYPAVEVVDTGDSVVIPTIHYDSVDALTLTFGSPTSGKAFVN